MLNQIVYGKSGRPYYMWENFEDNPAGVFRAFVYVRKEQNGNLHLLRFVFHWNKFKIYKEVFNIDDPQNRNFVMDWPYYKEAYKKYWTKKKLK